MNASGLPQILVCAGSVNSLTELRRLLVGGGYTVGGHLLGSPDPDKLAGYQMAIIDGGSGTAALDFCRRLRFRLDEGYAPILVVTDDPAPEARLACFEAGADAYLLRPFTPGEVLAQVAAFLRIKETHDRLAEKAAEVHRINKRLQQAYQQIDQELQLAQRIQASFLPASLPQIPRIRLAVHSLLSGRVGGDFYDAFRLDESHIGFYLADSMGHGVPASLLTIFVKKKVRTKEVSGQNYRLIPPDEVLYRLNRDLIEQQLSEQPFITMIYGQFDHHQGILRFARAGHPYPLCVPRNGPVQLWKQEGLLLGVVDAQFPSSAHPLQPGDKVLFYSDGIDNATFEEGTTGIESLLACAERYRALPAQDFVKRLARELLGTNAQLDDLTLLALEVEDGWKANAPAP